MRIEIHLEAIREGLVVGRRQFPPESYEWALEVFRECQDRQTYKETNIDALLLYLEMEHDGQDWILLQRWEEDEEIL